MSVGSRSTRPQSDQTLGTPLVEPEIAEGSGLLDRSEADNNVSEGEEEQGTERPRRQDQGSKRTTSRRLDKLESVLRSASLVAISISVMLAAFQYYQSRVDERKERSVALMNSWRGSEERVAYYRLSEALELRLEASGPLVANVTPAALVQIKYNIGEALIEAWSTGEGGYDGWYGDIDSIFDYFSEVEFCIQAGLCDESLLLSYFGREASDFWEYFQSFAVDRRATYFPDYGASLQSFVERLR